MAILTTFKTALRKFGIWLLAILIFFLGLSWANQARRAKKRGDKLIEKSVKEADSQKIDALDKAEKLRERAQSHYDRAQAAKQEAEDAATAAENLGSSTMADRVRRWNSGVRSKPPG